jgi:carboxyl-terminal processing protease
MKYRFTIQSLTLLCFLAMNWPCHSQDAVDKWKLTFDSVYDKLMKRYVEKLDAERLVRYGINGSLQTLDPYTMFMDSSQAIGMRENLQGKFGGVGIVMYEIDKTVTVTELFKGCPAERAGLRVGDIIEAIDGQSLKDRPFLSVFPLLRGKPGTAVQLTIFRKSIGKSLDVPIVREEIALSSVPFYGILPGDIGYIKILGETEGVAADTRKAFMKMRSQRALKGLILDLRGNLGGYMNEAIKIVNMFVDKGQPVISEKSWYRDTTFYLEEEAIDTSIPLALLTDSLTVSSGEIITGALQDHDRALIIGQKTYGKGMVQQLYDLPGGQLLKETTAFYHTPSGRCIQVKDYEKDEHGVVIADSVKRYFKTIHGRQVRDHDAISPDITTPVIAISPLGQALLPGGDGYVLLFKFAMQYAMKHPSIAAASSFRISDADYNAFVQILKADHLKVPSASDGKLAELARALEKDGYGNIAKAEIDRIREQLDNANAKELSMHKEEVKSMLEGEICSIYYYNAGQLENGLKDDPTVKKALESLSNQKLYAEKLSHN